MLYHYDFTLTLDAEEGGAVLPVRVEYLCEPAARRPGAPPEGAEVTVMAVRVQVPGGRWEAAPWLAACLPRLDGALAAHAAGRDAALRAG